VLFAKAAKELLAVNAEPAKAAALAAAVAAPPRVSAAQVAELAALRALFAAREAAAGAALGAALAAAAPGGAPGVYDAWMHRESDAVQALACAHGERAALEAGAAALAGASPAAAALLEPVLRLYALSHVEAELGWFMTQGMLDRGAGAAVPAAARRLCAHVAGAWRPLVAAFGIPDHLVAAPAAADWEAHQAGDNRGEVLGQPF
jgi:acyl-CoA oxidase